MSGCHTTGWCRVCLGMLKHRCLGQYTSVQTLGCVSDRDDTAQRTAELESNGYSATVSAEGNRLMNERVPHHRVVSGVLRDTQTPASRSHTSVQTLGCVLGVG